MKTNLFTKNGAFLLLMLMITSVTFSQGLEDFTNFSLSGNSYQSGSFTGNNGIAWDYVDVRGDAGPGNVNYPNVDYPAMMFGTTSHNSSITSSLIPNGIQNFSVKLYKAFTGTSNRQVELFINGQSIAQSTPFDDFDEHIFTVNNINVAGDFTLEIKNAGSQVVIDDISWTAYNPGVNLPPTISQITLTPDAHNIKSTDIVIVEAMIVDSDGVASATLNWGTTSGNLTNSVAMTLGSANVYDATIPAQADGTTVYFEITATDLLAATATTLEYDYTVADIPILSLPYANGFRTQADYDQAENLGFTITNSSYQTGGGGYLRIEANGSLTSPLIDFSTLDAILFDFSMTTYGGDSGQGLQVSISEDGGSTFTALDTYTATTSYVSHTQFIDLSSINSTDGMIRVALVPGTGSTTHVARFRDMEITESSGGNLPPTISQITLTPDAHNIKSTDIVIVEAMIVDSDGVASATLNWGTTSGNLTNSVAMTLGSANVYDATIPAQADGTTVYFEITATDSLSETATTQEYDYTVADIPMLSLPYSNNFRTQADYDQAENLGFTLTNTTQQTSAGGYLRIEANGSVTTPLIDFSVLDEILFDFSMTSFGGNSEQGLQVSISEDGGSTFTDLDFYEVPSSSSNYDSHTQFIDLSSINSTDGMIRVSLVPGTSNSHVVRFRDMNITEFSGYFYSNGWSPANPELISTVADDVYVVQGTVDILSDLSSKNFVVFPGAAANIHAVLSVAEDLSINGDLRFISGPNSIGELAEMSPTSNIFGQAEVQIYSSDRRAYRMVSSAVTTPTSIHDNWQEGATSNIDDPAPGFGTHITGTLNDQEDGFDATQTGNPSMFTVDVSNQQFIPISNTDVNTLDAGTPYLLFIRGDRSIDLNSNTSHSSTVLRSKGELQHGSITVNNFPVMQAGEYAMFGNPYQSAVDITQVFAASDSINTAHYYVFDPNLGDNGSYVTVDLTTGSGTNTSDSPANKYLQPGQAAQFATIQNGSPVLNFSEAHKAPGNHTQTSAQRMTISDMVTFQLFTTDNFSNGETLHDSFGIVFSPNYSNNLDEFDASKPMNFDENMGLNVNGKLISLERREMPVEGEVYQIHTSGYSTENYTIKMMIDGLDNFVLTLYDAYEDTYTQLVNNDATIYNFEVSENDANSLAENRFSIHVEDLLSVNAYNSSTIRIYPNPIVSDSFAIFAPNQTGKEASVSIIDMLGRTVYVDVYTIADGTATVNIGQNMNEGIYIVKLIIDGETQTFRVIKK